MVGGFEPIATLGVLRVQKNKFTISSPFLAAGTGRLVRSEILERSKQEGAKLAFQGMHLFQKSIFEEMQEKTLGKILCIVRSIPASTGESV